MKVAPASVGDAEAWLRMRKALWPHSGDSVHEAEIAEALASPGATHNLIARSADGAALGFLEAALRHDYVNGCKTSPVAFLEGIFVEPQARGQGVARAMIEAAEDWARAKGCVEFASDTPLDNLVSQSMHRALGFEETQRVVFFRKVLD